MNNRTGQDFIAWEETYLKSMTEEEKRREEEKRLRELLVAQGKHINMFKS